MPQAFHHHFRRTDPTLHGVIRQVGPYTLRPHRNRFGMLVRSIISQQISIAAANTIRLRLEALLGDAGLQPQAIATLSLDELRGVGLSRQKANYVSDLAHKVADGTVPLARMGRLSDAAIIETLTQVNGIGVWTAQMFLIFALGRPDVFPVGDLGVQVALRHLYKLGEKPDKQDLLAIGQRWSPYASIGSWYCWRYLERRRAQA
jgi:DNA-3-methyladenine glycosylase II